MTTRGRYYGMQTNYGEFAVYAPSLAAAKKVLAAELAAERQITDLRFI